MQIIKDYIQHDDRSYTKEGENGEKYPIFKDYLEKREKFGERKKDAIFKSSKFEEAKTLITNILILHSLFQKELIVKKLICKGINQEIQDKLNSVEKEIKPKFSTYYYWMTHFEKFKELLVKGIDFNQSIIDGLLKDHATQNQTPDFLKSDFQGTINFQKSHLIENITALNLHAIRLIETIEQTTSSQEESPDSLAKKAKYYVQLKEFGVAEKILDQILKENPEHSQAWYLKALIYLHHKRKADEKLFNLNVQIDCEGFDGEQWFGDERDSAESDSTSHESEACDFLLKALQFWPLIHQSLYEDDKTRTLVIIAAIDLIHRSIKRSSIFANIFNDSEEQKSKNQMILSILKEIFQFENKGYGLGNHTRLNIQKITDHSWALDIRCLEIYEKLDSKNYHTYFQHWWEKYGRYYKEKVENERFIQILQKNLNQKTFLDFTKKYIESQKNELDYNMEVSIYDTYLERARHPYIIAKRGENYQDSIKNYQNSIKIIDESLNYSLDSKMLYLFIRTTYDLATLHFKNEKL